MLRFVFIVLVAAIVVLVVGCWLWAVGCGYRSASHIQSLRLKLMLRARAASDSDEPLPRRHRRVLLQVPAEPCMADTIPGAREDFRLCELPAWMQHPHARHMLFKYATGKLSARDLCTDAWTHRGHAGFEQYIQQLAVAPVGGNGNAERRIRLAMDDKHFVESEATWKQVPMMRRGRRIFRKHPFLMPHDRVDESALPRDAELASLPVHNKSLEIMELADDNPRVALLHGYTDAVPCTGRARTAPDSLIVFTWVPIDDVFCVHARRLITVALENRCCQCGCSGRCTVGAITQHIADSFAKGDGRHDELKVRLRLSTFGIDWEAKCSVFGLKPWSSKTIPCSQCTCTREDMHAYATTPWPFRSDEDYRVARESCAVRADVDDDKGEEIQSKLWYDKRKQGSNGRALR